LHKALATASGAAGGSLGLMTAPLELPISTIIMLRSIADIARSEGENLAEPDAALACVQVFALGARSGDATESGYFVARGMLAKAITEAARFIAERGIVEEGAPILVRFIAQVASRFGVVVTQKLAAQTLPVVGALGGAAVNYAFIDHFQDVARGHFAIRRLERSYGKEVVRAQYERIRTASKASLPSELRSTTEKPRPEGRGFQTGKRGLGG
jgi:nucleoside 2-deoxyribosyltransferase